MLKSRVITATLLIIAVLATILFAPLLVKAAVLLLFSLGCGHEWLKMIGATTLQKIFFYLVLVISAAVIYLTPPVSDIVLAILWISTIGWLFAFIAILFYQRQRVMWSSNRWINTLIGLWLIVPFWTGSYFLLAHFLPKIFLILLLVVCCADSFAYFSGRLAGRMTKCHLLASHVSPGKTWEGVIGGMLSTAIILLVVLLVLDKQILWSYLLFMVFAIIPISIVGDLFESMVKRIYGVKDSGTLLPGHGGLLDRLDSLTAAVPIFAFVILSGLFTRGGY